MKELEYSRFLRFIRHSEGTSREDYLRLEKQIFKGMFVGKIFDDAKQCWKKGLKNFLF